MNIDLTFVHISQLEAGLATRQISLITGLAFSRLIISINVKNSKFLKTLFAEPHQLRADL